MRAVVLEAPAPIDKHPLVLRDVPVPEPGPGQLLVKVEACGVCRSNLHMIEGDWQSHGVPGIVPIVPGHEVVGTVAALGPGVDEPGIGTRIGVQPLWSTCLACEWCLTGREQLCPSKKITGETVDGGYAEYMVASAAHTYAVPESLDSAEAAPLFCPGVTAYGAVHAAQLSAGSRVAIFGIGGVGHMVVQLAVLTGAEVVAVSRGRRHLDLAQELGAGQMIDPNSPDADECLRAHGGVDAAVVFAPSRIAVAQAIAAVKPGGRVVLGVSADLGDFPFQEAKTVVGTVIGSRYQMHQVLALAAAGKLRAHVERAPLESAAEVLERLKNGDIAARAVLTTT